MPVTGTCALGGEAVFCTLGSFPIHLWMDLDETLNGRFFVEDQQTNLLVDGNVTFIGLE